MNILLIIKLMGGAVSKFVPPFLQLLPWVRSPSSELLTTSIKLSKTSRFGKGYKEKKCQLP